MLSVFVLLLGPINNVVDTGHAEQTLVTLVDEGFEDGIPDSSDGWVNTGWLWDHYGSPCEGLNFSYSWAAGDELTTPDLEFGSNTTISFQNAAEISSHPMDLELWIDYGTSNQELLWSEYDYTHACQINEFSLDATYEGVHTITWLGNTSDFRGQILDDLLIQTLSDSDDTPTDDPNDNDDPGDNGGNTGGDNGGVLPPPENQPPVADVSSGKPYNGIVGENILFNGSASSDSDGEIVSWEWDFDDGNTGTGETVMHTFSEPGFYTISLTVTDDDGATNTTIVQSDIGKESVPPSTPSIKLPDMPLNQNESYSFTVRSSDEDDEQIKYVLDWGDGTDNTTDYQLNNTEITRNHSWTSAGRYILTVTATDESNTSSNQATAIVLVDVTVKSIDNENITGVLIDYHQTGEFDVFYNMQTGDEVSLQKMDASTYLIDSNDDGIWDYSYSLSKGLTPYDQDSSDNDDKNNDRTDTESESPGFELFFIALALLFFLVIKKRFR